MKLIPPGELFELRVWETITSVSNIFEVVWSWEALVGIGTDEMDSTYPVAPNSTNLESKYACSFWSFTTSWSSSFSFCWRLYYNSMNITLSILNVLLHTSMYFRALCSNASVVNLSGNGTCWRRTSRQSRSWARLYHIQHSWTKMKLHVLATCGLCCKHACGPPWQNQA